MRGRAKMNAQELIDFVYSTYVGLSSIWSSVYFKAFYLLLKLVQLTRDRREEDDDKREGVITTMTRMPSILLVGLLLLGYSTFPVKAEVYAVSPDGSPYSIEEAMDLAGPGDTVTLADGVYTAPIVTTKDGEEGNPITIEGGTGAIISGESDDKVVTVLHSWISLEGFTVDGQKAADDSKDSYIGKCVYVWGQKDPKAISFSGGEALASIIGFSMKGLTVQNCG